MSINRNKEMEKLIKIEKVCSYFGLSEVQVLQLLDKRENETGLKLVTQTMDGLVLPSYAIEEMFAVEKTLMDLIFEDKNIIANASDTVPFDTAPRIYFLLDKGIVVYVGQSRLLVNRIGQHVGGKDFDMVATYQVSQKDLTIIESMNIRFYKPKYNQDYIQADTYFKEILSRCCFE